MRKNPKDMTTEEIKEEGRRLSNVGEYDFSTMNGCVMVMDIQERLDALRIELEERRK